MLGSKFVKFLTSILKRQVSSSSVFVSFSIVMTDNFSVNFTVIQVLLWAKGSHQSSNFDTFECSGENLPNSSCHFPSNKSVFLQILHHSSMSWEITPLYFLAQTIYTLLKRSPLKWKFLRLSSAQVKICQIPYATFETTSRFLSKFYIPLQFYKRLFLCTFLAWTICTLLKRSPLKRKCLKLSSAQVKICQIPCVNFETTSRFLSKFCIQRSNYRHKVASQ